MNKIVVEVGSTVTKVDLFDGEKITRLENCPIWFKKNFKKDNKLDIQDVNTLVDKVLELNQKYNEVYVCGTSIFRDLTDIQRNEFLKDFKNRTGVDFEIISQEKENELTVLGATKATNQKVAVFVAGGGSTEITVFDEGIKETANSNFGVIDVMDKFPDLADDLATADLETVKSMVRGKLNLPKEKVDVLILAGGAHKYFALNSGFRYEENKLYNDNDQPIMMNIDMRKKDSERYYKEISLDEICSKVDNPKWWFATRAMVAEVLVIAEEVGAKYIVPTDISMVYGLLK